MELKGSIKGETKWHFRKNTDLEWHREWWNTAKEERSLESDVSYVITQPIGNEHDNNKNIGKQIIFLVYVKSFDKVKSGKYTRGYNGQKV